MLYYNSIIGSSLLVYFMLCSIAYLAGYGLLRILRLDLTVPSTILLAPVITFVFWSVVLGVTVGIYIPVKVIAPWLWAGTGLLVLNGLPRKRLVWQFRSGLLLFCSILPIIVMVRYFWYGLNEYNGSIMPDGWSYISFGQYLWEYERGHTGGLTPLYQYAYRFSNTRYISSAFLGFFSVLVSPGDTQTVSALFQAWTLFSIACAIAFFWTTETTHGWMIIIGTVLSIVAGWMANLTMANNFDNGLALVYAPACGGIINILETRSWRWWSVLGCMLAGLFYTYAEVAPIIMASIGFIALPRVWHERSNWILWLRGIAIMLVVACIILLPICNTIVIFILSQFASASTNGLRPGEGFFRGLLNPQFVLAAVWGLGGEHQITELFRLRNLLALVMTFFAAAGTIVLVQRHKWGLAGSIICLLIGTAYFIIQQRYSYGAYKLIIINWWGMIAAFVIGIGWGIEILHNTYLKRGAVIASSLLIISVLLQSNHINGQTTSIYLESENQQLSFAQFRDLSEIKDIIGDKSVAIMVDEWLANEWSAYYLRDTPTALVMRRMYLDYPLSKDDEQKMTLDQLQYVLTDAKPSINTSSWKMVWSNDIYKLWKVNDAKWAVISNITNPNDVEQIDGGKFIWLGNGDSIIEVFTPSSGNIFINAKFTLGPSVSNQIERNVLMITNNGDQVQFLINSETDGLSVPVQAGITRITLRPLDQPDRANPNSPDKRPLVLGMLIENIQWKAEHTLWATISHITNANGIQHIDGKQFTWLGNGDTTIDVFTSQPGQVFIDAQFRLGPSVSNQDHRTVRLTTNNGYQAQLFINPETDGLSVPVQAGTTRITLRPLDQPDRANPNSPDKRPLVLGMLIENIQWKAEHTLWATISHITNANGIQHIDGKQFTWLGNGDTTIDVFTSQPGQVFIDAQFRLGPSVSNQDHRTVHLTTNNGYQTQLLINPETNGLLVPVQAGTTRITLRPLDQPDRANPNSLDKRPLVLGMLIEDIYWKR